MTHRDLLRHTLLSCLLCSVAVSPLVATASGAPPHSNKGGKKYKCLDGTRVASPDQCEDGSIAMLTTGPSVSYEDQYKNSLTKAQTIDPIAEFGESVSLRDGTVSFRNVDIELPGTGPTIRIVRTAAIQDGQGGSTTTRNAIGQWELEIPRIKTVTALPDPFLRASPVSTSAPSGWQVSGANKNARCSNISIPADVEYPALPAEFYANEWWAGYQLVDGEGNPQPLMVRSTSLPNAATIGTMDNWIVTCLSTTANSSEAPGEAFLATAPDGTKYWFNYLVYDSYPTLIKDFPDIPPNGATYTFGLPRQHASMYVTRVEDRFGNWLTYTYSGGLLSTIDASDGRRVQISRGTATTITAGTAPNTRSWTYQTDVPGYSLVVTRPDASSWKYLGDFAKSSASTYSFYNCDQAYEAEPNEARQVSVTAPSSATAQFNLQRKTFGRSYAPKYCHQNSFPGEPWAVEEVSSATIPRIWTGFALTSKVVSGPAITSQTWSYSYSAHNGCWDPAVTTYLSTSTAVCNGTSPTTVWTDRTSPDGDRLRSTFSNRYDQSENKLISEQVYSSTGALMNTTTYTYAVTPSTGGNPFAFPLKPGLTFSVNANFESEGRWTPISKKQITQQGRTFSWEVATDCSPYTLCFDHFARPTKVVKTNSP